MAGQRAGVAPAGFTLVELLVVIVIILLVSVVALPTVLPALRHREVSESARLLQGAVVGARDQAIHDGHPSGFRLLPDPAFPITYDPKTGQVDPNQTLAYNRVVPIGPAPDYSEGSISIYTDGASGSSQYPATIRPFPCLVLEQAVFDSHGLPNPPTSWFWNIRVGDQIQLGGAGPWYTVVGPARIAAAQGNPELFVNFGLPGAALPTLQGGYPCEFLLLVNGRDDGPTAAAVAYAVANGLPVPTGPDGWVDSGWDGVDNDNDPNNIVDNLAEWEVERWLGSIGP